MSKNLGLLLTLFVLVGSLLSVTALDQHAADLTRGWEDATESQSSLPHRLPLSGVNADLTQYSDDELELHLQAMVDQGVVWVRQFFLWSAIEPEQGSFAWEPWDRIVTAVSQHDSLQIVAVLHTAPEWARHSEGSISPTAPPADTNTFEAFSSTFATRYGEAIDYYQIWDEPNLTISWGDTLPNASAYGALLQAGYTGIRAVDATATIIAAALAPTIERGPQNYSDVLFLRQLYAIGAASYFDAAAAKPYGFDSSPYDRVVDENILNFSRMILLREEMIRQGDGEKPLWGSAFGWNALPEDWRGAPSIWGSTDRNTQLEFIRGAYERATAEWPWSGGLILQAWQPAAPSDDPIWGFALIRTDQDLTGLPANLFGVDGVGALPGRHSVSTPYADYTGEWEFGELGADIGYAQDSEFTFTFQGTAVALELRRGNYRGYLYVTVDDMTGNALLQDNAGNSYIILNASDNQTRVDVIKVAENLLPGQHTLHARAEYGWDQWALVGYRVAVPPPTRDSGLRPILIGIGGLAGCALIYLGRRWSLPAWPRIMQVLVNRLGKSGQLIAGVLASLLLMIGMALTWSDAVPNLLRRDPPGILLGLLTSGLLYLSDPLLLTLGAGIVLWILIYNRLEIGLLLTVLWAPFFLYPLTLYQYAIPMAEVCLLLTAGAWLLRLAVQWAKDRSRASHHPAWSIRRLNTLDLAVIAFLGIATLSLTWAEFGTVALREWRTMIVEPVLFYAIVRTTLRSRAELVRMVDALIASAVLAAVVGIALYVAGENIVIAEGASRRLAGIYGSPNNVGLYMGRVLPFALVYIVSQSSVTRRILAGISAGIIMVATGLSQSAGALLLGIPASLLVLLYLWNRRYALIALAVGAASALIAVIPLSQHPRFARLLDFSSGTTFFRLRVWQSAWRMIEDRPLQGFGLDQFLYQYRGRYILPDAWQEPNLSHPHNIILDFWTRLGLGGLLVLLALQYAFWKRCIALYRQLPRLELPWLILIAGMASMVDLLVHGLVDNSVFVIDLSYVFMLLLALPSVLTSLTVDPANQ